MSLNSLYLNIMRRMIATVLIITLVLRSLCAYAQNFMATLPEPGKMVAVSDAFMPVLVKGLVVHPDEPFNFSFIVDSGDEAVDPAVIKGQSEKIVKYFLAALTVPEKSLWVNLSPYEKDRIIEDGLGQTLLGRDMLAQDYVLKQLTASLIYPEDKLGKDFWSRVYKKAQEEFGTTDIPIDTFNKVWVVPVKAAVFEKDHAVYVTDARLKVMLDSDYRAAARHFKSQSGEESQHSLDRSIHGVSHIDTVDPSKLLVVQDDVKRILREVVIPAIETEVNYGKNFSTLRQVYYAAILAKWYRELVQDTLMARGYVDKNKIAGVDSDDKTFKEQIYQRYIAAYKQGVFNYIKDDADPVSGDAVPRKYFSGGFQFGNIKLDEDQRLQAVVGRGKTFRVDFAMHHVNDSSERVRPDNANVNVSSKTLKPQRIVSTRLADDRLVRDASMSDILTDIALWILGGVIIISVFVTVVGGIVVTLIQRIQDLYDSYRTRTNDRFIAGLILSIKNNVQKAVDRIDESVLAEGRIRQALIESKHPLLIKKVGEIDINSTESYLGLLAGMDASHDELSDIQRTKARRGDFNAFKWLEQNDLEASKGFLKQERNQLIKFLRNFDERHDYRSFNVISNILDAIGDENGKYVYNYTPPVTTPRMVSDSNEEYVPSMTGGGDQIRKIDEKHEVSWILQEGYWEKHLRRDSSQGLERPIENTVRSMGEPSTSGGIDIQNIDVNKTSTAKIKFDDAALQRMFSDGFEGFTPVFIKMTPVENPLMILGVALTDAKDVKV